MRLTKAEKEAVLDILHERLAGGTEDLKDALGISEKEADKMMERLNNVVLKLTK
jgi:predicted transcriptional regulator